MISHNEYDFFKGPNLLFEKADKEKKKVAGEKQILGLIVDRDSPFVVSLIANPLISCNAYIFSYLTYDGVEKVIIYHANSCGPLLIDWIAAQIVHETDLNTVSIIIATPGNDLLPGHIAADIYDISNFHWEKLSKAGFTNKIQILFNCCCYTVNSKGKHGEGTCKTALSFNTLPTAEIKVQQADDSPSVSTCSLL